MDSNKAVAYAAYDIPPISCTGQTIHLTALGDTLTLQDHIYISFSALVIKIILEIMSRCVLNNIKIYY